MLMDIFSDTFDCYLKITCDVENQSLYYGELQSMVTEKKTYTSGNIEGKIREAFYGCVNYLNIM